METPSLSDGVDKFLNVVRPYGGPTTWFPKPLKNVDVRRVAGESLRDWFKRLVAQACDNKPGRVALEKNIAVFASLRWHKKQLTFANVQTLVTHCDLADYLDGSGGDAVYLRMDYDVESLGDLFTHPLPHVHTDGPSSPRFVLDGGDSGNVIVDYLEFIYRTYKTDDWIKWVRRVWGEELSQNPLGDGKADPLKNILEAFKAGKIQSLRDRAADLGRIKRVLRASKDQMFNGRADGKDRELLAYPASE